MGTVQSSISCYARPERHQGAFHTGNISGSTGLNVMSARIDRKLSGTNRFQLVRTEIPHSICPFFLFRPATGAWNSSGQFQSLPVSVVHGQSQLFFPFLIVSFKMASALVCRLKIVLNSVNISSNETAQTPSIATAATFSYSAVSPAILVSDAS